MCASPDHDWNFVCDDSGFQTTEGFVESVADFSECVFYVWHIKWRTEREALRKRYPQYVEEEFPWFRGESDIGYELIPGLYWTFPNANAQQLVHVAEDLREEFRRRGEYLVCRLGRNLGDGELYELMRHFALPTRLLDWTEGALIALYFAARKVAFTKCDSSEKERIPCVWILNPSWLNDKSIGTPLPTYLTESAMEKYPNTDGNAISYLNEKELPPDPIAVYPHYLDPKMCSQRSTFTIHGRQQRAFRELCVNNPSAQLCRIKVKPDRIDRLASELRLMGITESTIFPDLKGVANEIRSEKGARFCLDR